MTRRAKGMPIDASKPCRQYRFNVAMLPWEHVFKTQWGCDDDEKGARQLFALLRRKFPESEGYAVTGQTRVKPPTWHEVEELDWDEMHKDLAKSARYDEEDDALVVSLNGGRVLRVPRRSLKPSGTGVEPDIERVVVIDCGQTVALGDYEAAVDALIEADEGPDSKKFADSSKGLRRSLASRLRKAFLKKKRK